MRPHVLLIFITRYEESQAMLKGIAHFERSHRVWDTFLDDDAYAERDPHWLVSKPWRGVISRHTSPAFAQRCRELGIALVDLNDAPVIPGVPKIRPDNRGLGHLGAEHFLERGFTSFAFCGFGSQPWSGERRDGYVEALRLAGLACEVFDVPDPVGPVPGWDSRRLAELGLWLSRLPRPTAVLACNDFRAQQVMYAAQHVGLQVPEDIAVLGINNDIVRCDLTTPPLSSVATNGFQSGYHAGECLSRLMAGKVVEQMDQRIEGLGVVTRPSTDVLSIEDKSVALALKFIREQACTGIFVSDVLKHAFTSRSQLEKKFRRFIGRSPQAEIRRVQVAKIRQLLVETDLPLKKIAEFTGFEHVEYLSVVFKRFMSDSPGSYRKRMQGETAG